MSTDKTIRWSSNSSIKNTEILNGYTDVSRRASCVPVGVPLIAQVVLLILSPAGKAGLAEQFVTTSETVGVLVTMANPCV